MSTYTVTRSVDVAAPPSRVHALVDNFHEWSRWSPWEDIDPTMQRTYAGPPSGVGAHYAWSGQGKAGSGTMEIEASAPERIGIRLEFTKPFTALCPTVFTFEETSGGSRVSWIMTGENRGIMVLLAPLMRIKTMIGRDFEKGLARLKAVAEAG